MSRPTRGRRRVVAVEAVGLIYNKALVPTAPATMEEIADMKIEGVSSPILWDYNKPYFSFPLLMAGGGFAFEKKEGSYDPTTTGVANAGAIAGATVRRIKGAPSGTLVFGPYIGLRSGTYAAALDAILVDTDR